MAQWLSRLSTSVILRIPARPCGVALCIVHPNSIARQDTMPVRPNARSRRTDPAWPPALRSKTNSETSGTVRICRRAPLIVSHRPRQRYDLSRKYQECRKIPSCEGIACTWPFGARASRKAHCRFRRCSGDSALPPRVPEGSGVSMACQDLPRSAANAIPFTIQPVKSCEKRYRELRIEQAEEV
jgi:hypothetical protein